VTVAFTNDKQRLDRWRRAAGLPDFGQVLTPADGCDATAPRCEVVFLVDPLREELTVAAAAVGSPAEVVVAYGGGSPPPLATLRRCLDDADLAVTAMTADRGSGLPGVRFRVRAGSRPPASGLSEALQLAELTASWRLRRPLVAEYAGVTMTAGLPHLAEGFGNVYVLPPRVLTTDDLLDRYLPRTVIVGPGTDRELRQALWSRGTEVVEVDPAMVVDLIPPTELGNWTPTASIAESAAGGSTARSLRAAVRSGAAPADDELAMSSASDADSDLALERRAVRAWRLAGQRYSTDAWWAELLGPPRIRVSLLMTPATSSGLERMLAAAAVQRYPDLELVIGLPPDMELPPGPALSDTPHVLVRLRRPGVGWDAELVVAATGELLASWGPGWYGPDHVADLVAGWRFSGATLVAKSRRFGGLDRPVPVVGDLQGCTGRSPVASEAALIARDDLDALGVNPPGPALSVWVRDQGGSVRALHGFGFVADVEGPQAAKVFGRRRASIQRCVERGSRLTLAAVDTSPDH
jgi:hypothetical protein